jgi:hypothetical protein
MPTTDGQQQLGRKLSEIANHVEDDPKELLKNRFLSLEGLLGIYGQTGIGKSSFAMQCMILWSLGRGAFGITPKRQLKSLMIQAENDDGDIAEMRDGIIAGLKLPPADSKQACDNIIVIQEDSQTGRDFFDKTVRVALEQHKPDLLWIDPALQYLGGDSISQETVGGFLRNLLKPLLKIHQCASVIVHHVNKSGKTDTAYAGSGSAEWANMPRAILTITPTVKGMFELVAAKRGGRLRWKMPDGKTGTITKLIKHSTVEGQIFWQEAEWTGKEPSNPVNKGQVEEDAILACVPEEGTIEKNLLEVTINKKANIGLNRTTRLLKGLIQSRKLFELKVPRTNARPEIHISLHPPVNADAIKQP